MYSVPTQLLRLPMMPVEATAPWELRTRLPLRRPGLNGAQRSGRLSCLGRDFGVKGFRIKGFEA